MGLDMGIEMDFTSKELNRVIDICQHMIGLNYKRPYHRHGKAFYKPYRNYYCDIKIGNNLLNRLPKDIINVQKCDNHTYYWLTINGLKWLGRQLNIVIKEDGKEN